MLIHRIIKPLGALAFVFFLSACGTAITGIAPDPEIAYISAPTGKVNLSWDTNRENGVNAAGGGYKVYWATQADYSDATVTDLSYVSGSTAPNSIQITDVAAGKYYLKVVAYTTINPTGSTPLEKVVRVK